MMKRPLFFAGCIYLVMAAVSFVFSELSLIFTFALLLILLFRIAGRKTWKSLLFATIASAVACASVFAWQQKAEEQLYYAGETVSAEGMITDCTIYDSAIRYNVEIPLNKQTMKLKLWS